MIILSKRILLFIGIAVVLFLAGFIISSGVAGEFSRGLWYKAVSGIQYRLQHHIAMLPLDIKKYFLLPQGSYAIHLYAEPISPMVIMTLFFNSIFNVLFQPVFFCPFTPQAIMNILVFPFFLYGAVRFYKKTWLLLLIFFILAFHIGVWDCGVEALIRHGMLCELIYLMIGLAGFSTLITKNS